jgi:hypothetical protein
MQQQVTPVQPGTAFWVIGVAALLWNLFGLWAFYAQVTATPEQLAGLYDAEQVALIEATPVWAMAMTAIATIAGVLGSILLLMRNRLAVSVYVVSLAAIVLQDIYIFGMTNSVELFGAQPMVIQGIVLVVAVFLVWYSRQQRSLGVLR